MDLEYGSFASEGQPCLRNVVAAVLGWTSIGCWLCAQFPQVLKNISLQSADGLALPFLLNWLFGDLTNIIGCILTDQLPFQTYLAAYFCLVDFCLLAQYYYYANLRPRSPAPKSSAYLTSPHQSLILPSPYCHARALSTSASASNPTTHSRQPLTASTPSSTTTTVRPHPRRSGHSRYSASSLPHTPEVAITAPTPQAGSYEAIYEAAMDVARVAERAESRRAQSLSRTGNRAGTGRHARQARSEVDEGARSGMQGMMESFHSEMSAASSSTTGEEHDRRRLSLSMGSLLDSRGRKLRRAAGPSPTMEEGERIDGLPSEGGRGAAPMGTVPPIQEEMREARSKSRSLSLVRGSGGRGKGRKAAGMAFMAFALVLRFGGEMAAGSAGVRGVVLSPSSTPRVAETRHPTILRGVSPSTPASGPSFVYLVNPPDLPHPPEEPPDWQRVVGRISAWTCTTLYLTSRLPQIWKNFTRKSVEGLSILLFVFAFFGNLTYVLSIILNPAGEADPSEAGHYLLEALPYLLGSGGTLLFDLTIMVQSLIYGSAPPIPQTPREYSSTRRRLFRRQRYKHLEDGRAVSTSSERQPLLAGSQLMTGSSSSDRQPLLSGSQLMTGSMLRDRSRSPGVVMRGGGARGRRSSLSRPRREGGGGAAGATVQEEEEAGGGE